jgi:putative tryptophan/tyrosine transport system substrate-binding protein
LIDGNASCPPGDAWHQRELVHTKRLCDVLSLPCNDIEIDRRRQMILRVKRREFIALLGGATLAWPLAARAQQAALPVIGYLSGRSAESDVAMLAAVRRGLNEIGYVEGRNLAIEYRFADGQSDRVPGLLTELTRRQVAVIVIAGFRVDDVVQQMRASQIPIVFNTGADPVRAGLVASYNRPAGNVTGISSLVGLITGKNMGLLHELVPNAKTIALLLDPAANLGVPLRDAREGAATLGLQLRVLNAITDSELDAAFATLNQQPVDAMVVPTNSFFVTRAKQIAALVASHRLPAIYARREFAEAGGLMSYGYDVGDGYRQMGVYAGRILKGDKPADLPVVQPTKFELVINMKTAKALGFQVSDRLIALSDEIIE